MSVEKVDALLALRREGKFLVGRERITLLEAVARTGSITKAAKETGFSYKTAWEAVNSINNLLPSPAFLTKPGGRSGGGAEITTEGRRLIETFNRLEERLGKISELIATNGLEGQQDTLFWALGLKFSARNALQAVVTQIRKWPVDVEVTLELGDGHVLMAQVTNDAAEELDLKPGRRALALIKAPFVQICAASPQTAPIQNWFPGKILRLKDAERNTEILLDLGSGKTLTSIMPRMKFAALNLREGDAAAANFDADQIILAVD